MADTGPAFEFDQTASERQRRIRDLPTFYYHGHFLEMLEFVERHYDHALQPEHRTLLASFRALTKEAQCLYVRLFNRKGRVFAARRLAYPELGDCAPLLEELAADGWIAAPDARHFDELLHHATRATLAAVLAERFAGLPRSMKKADLVRFARANCDPRGFVTAIDDGLFVQKHQDALGYLSFLYFGRVQDGLDRFTMRDLGLVRTQDFSDTFEPRFEERDEALEHYYFALRLKQLERADRHRLRALASEADEWPEPGWSGAARERDRLAYRLGRALEREKLPDPALDVYARAESARAAERYVRLLLAAGRRAEAEVFLERCLDAPRSDEEWLMARDLYARKFRKKRTSTQTDRLRAGETIELDESDSGRPERAAAAWFESRGARAFRTENALWRTFFGLLFWRELYGESNSALHSPFDFVPSNLTNGSFAAEHADAIRERLGLLDQPAALKRHLLATSTAHYGKPNGLFRWRRSVLDALFAFVDVAPPDAMRAMLRRFCDDFHGARYGYPDLMVIDDDGVRFVEIKTDGDHLRKKQLLRLEQLGASGFRADVVRVRWTLDPEQVYVVVDVETTGGRGEQHRVTEIGAVKVIDDRIVDRYSTLINPQRTIPPGITRLTGISADMVADAPYFSDIADEFAEFMGDAIFVAHNVEFDYGFISREFRRIGRRFRHAKLCTCASMRRLYPGQRSYSLDSLCATFGIPLESHHRALCDAEAAAELLLLVNEKRREALA